MDDIIKLIRDAESEALKIKEEAVTRAVYIAENAEVEANKRGGKRVQQRYSKRKAKLARVCR